MAAVSTTAASGVWSRLNEDEEKPRHTCPPLAERGGRRDPGEISGGAVGPQQMSPLSVDISVFLL